MNAKLTFDDFTEKFIEALEKELEGKNIHIERQMVRKINRDLDAINIRMEGKNVSPLLYLDNYFNEYQKHGFDIGMLAKDTAEHVLESFKEMPDFPQLDGEKLKDKVYPVLVNYELNKEWLKDFPYKKFEDLAIVPRIKFNPTAEAFVSKALMAGAFKMTANEIMELALKNNEKREFEIEPLGKVIAEMMMEDIKPQTPEEEEMAKAMIDEVKEQNDMYIVSVPDKNYGASLMLSKEVLEKAYKTLEEDYFILPSSVHEILLINPSRVNGESYEEKVEVLKNMVKDVNHSSTIKDEDMLADSVYQYNHLTKKVSKVDIAKKELTAEQMIEKQQEKQSQKAKGR